MPQNRLHELLKFGLVAASLALVGYIDVLTGYEVSVFPLYALPVALAAWLSGAWAGTATSMIATAIWAWADLATGHVYSKTWILYVNGGARLAFFLFVALAVAYMIGNLRRARSQLQNFSGTLAVCTACSRVRDRDEYWWEVQAYLREYGGALTQAKLCPECAHEAYVTDRHSGAAAPR